MTPAIIPTDGKHGWSRAAMLSMLDPAMPAVVRLYRNLYTPDAGSVFSNFDEADFGGYAPLMLASLNPTDGEVEPSTGRLVWTFDQVVFTADGSASNLPQAAVGYLITWPDPSTDAGPRVMWARRFANPTPVLVPGDCVRFRLSLAFVQAG